MQALIRNALAQRKESVRVILRCEAKETLAGERCRLEKPEAYSLEYVEDFFRTRTMQMPADHSPE
jgi:hypothetical protein